MAGKFLVKDPGDQRSLSGEFSGSSCGRGITKADATYGCIAEAVERFSLDRREYEPSTFATIDQLQGCAVTPAEIQLFSERQYINRQQWNLQYPNEHHIPSPRLTDQPIHWMKPSSSLSTSTSWVPMEYCLFNSTEPQSEEFPAADSSGCAVGATLEDATTRGFLELVERDAVSIWWYGRIRRHSVSPDVFLDPLVSNMSDWCLKTGRNLFLLDLTSDLEIPVIAAISCEADGSRIAMGFGAAANKNKAAHSALGEMVQFQINVSLVERLNFENPGNSFLSAKWHLLTWSVNSSIFENLHLMPLETAMSKKQFVERDHLNLDDCHNICRKTGLELLAFDITYKQLSVPVVRVVVPSLRPIWPRFAPGRLYDVPIAQGWRDKDYSENDVNVTPILF
jgi:oxazoline/thiazoline synthase